MPISLNEVSRRQFLQWSLAAGAAVALPRVASATLPKSLTEFPAAAKPAPVFDNIALISDVHVNGGLLSGSMGKHLTNSIQQVLTLDEVPKKILLAGDCAHLTGNKEDYKEFVRRIKPITDAGIPIHMTLGNHDNRDHFWDALPAGQAEANAKLSRQALVVPGDHANWFMLDSLNKTNNDGGELGAEQLEWLAAELDARKTKPALVMLHHDLFRGGKQGSLKDADKLLDIVRPRRQVKALFWGHTHVWETSEDKSGIHMVNLPATGYTLWGKSFLGWTACRVYNDTLFLDIHALDVDARENGQKLALKHRKA